AELRADLVAEAPDHAALAALLAAREHQRELVRHVEAFGMQPHAAVGDVRDPAVARQRAEQDLRRPAHQMTRAAPALLGPFIAFEAEHANLLRPAREISPRRCDPASPLRITCRQFHANFASYIFNRRLALPLAILILSSSHSGTVCSQAGPGAFASNG